MIQSLPFGSSQTASNHLTTDTLRQVQDPAPKGRGANLRSDLRRLRQNPRPVPARRMRRIPQERRIRVDPKTGRSRPRIPSSIGLEFGRICFRHSRSSTRPVSAFTSPAALSERATLLPFAHTGCTASRDWLLARSINPPVGKALVARGAAAGAPASLDSSMTTSAVSLIKTGFNAAHPSQ